MKILLESDQKEIFIISQKCPILKIDFQQHNIPLHEEIPVGSTIRIRFHTPVVFSSDKRNAKSDPFPHMDGIFKHLISKYAQFINPISYEEQVSFTLRCLDQIATPDFSLQSKHLTLGNKIKITGFIGSILFKVESNEGLEYLLPALEFVKHWGIGGKTSIGFGNLSFNYRKVAKFDTDNHYALNQFVDKEKRIIEKNNHKSLFSFIKEEA
jgi:CRISPR-associated endoribonuclease Cas6